MKTYIIYIPGLGDRYDPFRKAALKAWKLWGVTAIHVPITWYDGGNLESKLAYIREAINDAPKDAKIVVMGESAGATLALHIADEDARVKRVVTLCGVAKGTTPISNYLRKRAPALNDGVDSLGSHASVDIHSVRAWLDGVVGKKYSVAPGAKEHVIWSIGHLSTIALCLTIYAPIIAAIAKKQ